MCAEGLSQERGFYLTLTWLGTKYKTLIHKNNELQRDFQNNSRFFGVSSLNFDFLQFSKILHLTSLTKTPHTNNSVFSYVFTRKILRIDSRKMWNILSRSFTCLLITLGRRRTIHISKLNFIVLEAKVFDNWVVQCRHRANTREINFALQTKKRRNEKIPNHKKSLQLPINYSPYWIPQRFYVLSLYGDAKSSAEIKAFTQSAIISASMNRWSEFDVIFRVRWATFPARMIIRKQFSSA